MSSTIVIQSHRHPLPFAWLEHCLESVRQWCAQNRFEYRYLNDELFDRLPADLSRKLETQSVIAADLARLYALQNALDNGYETAVWLDADFLIFDPVNFILPGKAFALGREVWVQADESGKLRVYRKVHNAFLLARRANRFLPFYIETAERLLRENQGGMPPQFIGPKLLTALHNVAQFPVMETAGMLSPLVVKAIADGGGEALQVFIDESSLPISGANLCISSCERGEITEEQALKAIASLQAGAIKRYGK